MELGGGVMKSCRLCSINFKIESLIQSVSATFVFLLVHILVQEVHGQFVVTDHKVTIQTGTRGLLPCRVAVEVYAIIWNKGLNFEGSTNIITLDLYNDVRERFGSGYDDESYNISDDFSLIINDVKVSSQGRYYCTVTPIDSSRVLYNHSDVSVFALPNETFPKIDECGNNNYSFQSQGQSCQIFRASPVNITCTVSGYYPNITLRFYNELSNVKFINSDEWINKDGTLCRFVTIRATPSDHPYICEVSNIPGSADPVKVSAKILVTLKSASPAAPESTAQSRDQSVPVWVIGLILVPAAGIAVIGVMVYKHIRRRGDDAASNNGIELAIPLLKIQEQSQYSCVNHEETPAAVKCIDCEEHLCSNCIHPTHKDHYLLSSVWEKERGDLVLPKSMRGNLNSLIGLKDGSLAVGYAGGIDIINLETGETRHILGETTVRYMDQYQDSNIVICDQDRTFQVYNVDGEFVKTLRDECETECEISLRVLPNGNILRGHADQQEICEISGSDGAEIFTGIKYKIPFAPWQMIAMSDSRVCVSSCKFGMPDPVLLLSKDRDHVSLIPKSSQLCPFITHDENENIYTVTLTHAKAVSIALYSDEGSKKEDIVLGMPMNAAYAVHGNWINISSLNNNRLAVADQERICFFRRRTESEH